MNNVQKKPVVSADEPLPGWLRFEVEGQKPWFKTPVPRTVIRDGIKLQDYLEKEHSNGRMLEISGKEFSFKRRLGLRQKRAEAGHDVDVNEETADEDVGDNVTGLGSSSIVDRLTRSGNIVDHKKLLSNSAKEMDCFRRNDGYQTPTDFADLKEKISSSVDLRAMLAAISSTPVYEAINLMFSDTCLTEISRINCKGGPLVDFPTDINDNIYCKVVEFGMKNCPSLICFVTSMVVRRGEPILPSDVLKVATLFSSICYAVNHNLDAMIKLREDFQILLHAF